MNDQSFERERPALEQQPSPLKSRVKVIFDARKRMEALALKFEESATTEKPKLMPLDLVAQSAQNEADAVRALNSLSTESTTKPEPVQPAIGELDIDMIRKQVEAA
jgi:hypothetical protein